MDLTHLNKNGEAHMVDIGEKETTRRVAVAHASIYMQPETLRAITEGGLPKGDVFAVARVAGIFAAKRTHELIPLCHQIPLNSVEISFAPAPPDTLRITATASASYKTGVEMEALTAASIAALTVYDMCKAIDKSMVVEQVYLLSKTGGKSGDYISSRH